MSIRQLNVYGLILILICACNKDDEDSGPDPSTETAAAIIMTPAETLPGGSQIYGISIFEPSGGLRWEKRRWGFLTGGMFVDKGHLFVAGAAPDYTYGKYVVYDLRTGVELWSRERYRESYAQSIVRNDTLFCSESVNLPSGQSDSYITAYNALTGDLYWKQKVGDYLAPLNLILKDSSLYFVNLTNTSGSSSKLMSLNIRSRNINWTRNLSGTDLYAGIPMCLFDDRLLLTVINPQYGWAGVNRYTGVSNLSVVSQRLRSPVLYKGFMYGVSDINPVNTNDGIYVFNALNGAQRWKASIPDIYPSSCFTLSDAGVFILANDFNGYYIKGYDVTAGTLKWSIRFPGSQILYHPVTVGDKLFTHNLTFDPVVGQFTKSQIMLHDVTSGQARDSFNVPGYINSPFYVVSTSENIYSTIQN